MSIISTTNIDETYPIAGEDNNSQGFRDNFNNIKIALEVAKSEIGNLETYTAKLGNEEGDPVVNDFNGNSITDAIYYNFNGKTVTHPNFTGALGSEIKPQLGPVHVITMSADDASTDVVITFDTKVNAWPQSTNPLLYSQVRLFISNAHVSVAKTITFTVPSATVRKNSSFPSPFVLAANTGSDTNRVYIVDVSTYNTGTTVFMNYVGNFR
jgi:hypothetical protein